MNRPNRVISWESHNYDFDNIKKERGFDVDDYEDDSGEPLPKIMRTSLGTFEVDDSMNPFRNFQLWMGYTNFSIGLKCKNILESIPGVEVLIIVTRYRFIIGIGKMFEFSDVRVAIERALCGKHKVEALLDSISDADTRCKASTLRNVLKDTSKHWAIYIMPNGAIEHIKSDEVTEEFVNQLNVYKNAQELSHGIIIQSE